MSTSKKPPSTEQLDAQLTYLKLLFIREHYASLAKEAAEAHWGYVEFLARLVAGEALLHQERSVQRRIRQEQFQWNWPLKINRLQVQELFHLKFIAEKANVIFLAGVGLGKTHLATALGYAACLKGHAVRFATAVDVINTLAAAQSTGRLKQELDKYLKPTVLVLDELGYLPIDKTGADLLFQIISHRYERGATIITSNRVYKKWPEIFNNDSTLTSALLDRLLHHAETVIIEGKSYRMKDQIES
jgi:DNA replication protein DnaC